MVAPCPFDQDAMGSIPDFITSFYVNMLMFIRKGIEWRKRKT